MAHLFEKTDYEIEKFEEDAQRQFRNIFETDDFIIQEDAEQIKNQWLKEHMQPIFEAYKSEYDAYEEEGKYYFGCPFLVYKLTYNKREQEFLNSFDDVVPYDFIRHELDEGVLSYDRKYLEPTIKYNIEASLRKRIEFLEKKASEEGYSLKIIDDENAILVKNVTPEQLNHLENIIDEEIDEGSDLTKLKIPKRILFLDELGILDFLMKKPTFNNNSNKLARVLSPILGKRIDSIYTYTHPIHNPESNQERNPRNNSDNVDFVKQELNNIGYY